MNLPNKKWPLIALTMGDVAGIGPELVASAAMNEGLSTECRTVVVGHPEVLQRAVSLLESSANVVSITLDELRDQSVREDLESSNSIVCWNPGDDSVLDVLPGTVDARAGRAAHDYLVAAANTACEGIIDAITTAPLNKEALNLAGLQVPGHTEILAKVCNVDRFAMMLYLPTGEWIKSKHGLSIAHVTLHTSIASVPNLLSQKNIEEKIELVNSFMENLGCNTPRIAVCALNPHAGEHGLFGDEESRLITPAVEAALSSGLNVTGPLPVDTLIRRAIHGEFDGVVAMYHDQGHIPFKLIGFDQAINVTLGLPIVRTSPSHGTAFDIAWQGNADVTGFIEAIRVAVQLASNATPPQSD